MKSQKFWVDDSHWPIKGPATIELISEWESRHGLVLPLAFKELYLLRNGGHVLRNFYKHGQRCFSFEAFRSITGDDKLWYSLRPLLASDLKVMSSSHKKLLGKIGKMELIVQFCLAEDDLIIFSWNKKGAKEEPEVLYFNEDEKSIIKPGDFLKRLRQETNEIMQPRDLCWTDENLYGIKILDFNKMRNLMSFPVESNRGTFNLSSDDYFIQISPDLNVFYVRASEYMIISEFCKENNIDTEIVLMSPYSRVDFDKKCSVDIGDLFKNLIRYHLSCYVRKEDIKIRDDRLHESAVDFLFRRFDGVDLYDVVNCERIPLSPGEIWQELGFPKLTMRHDWEGDISLGNLKIIPSSKKCFLTILRSDSYYPKKFQKNALVFLTSMGDDVQYEILRCLWIYVNFNDSDDLEMMYEFLEEDDVKFDRIKDPCDLIKYIHICDVEITAMEKDGYAYLGLTFSCEWDQEHLREVYLHMGKVVSIASSGGEFSGPDQSKADWLSN